MVSSHMATNFPWDLQGTTFSHLLRLLQNGGCDIILGCDWIKAHTSVKFDYERMMVSVRMEGKKIKLQAQNSTAICRFISHHTLHKLMHSVGKEVVKEIYLVALQSLTMIRMWS